MATRSIWETREAIERLKRLYAQDQPTDFIALEFLVSPEILGAAQPGSLLWRALRDAERGVPQQGFAWLGGPNALARIVELTRDEIRRGNAQDVLEALLTEPHPAYLKSLDPSAQ